MACLAESYQNFQRGPSAHRESRPRHRHTSVYREQQKNLNCAQPTDGKIASPRPPINPDSDITLTASFGGNDSNYEYVKSTKNSPLRSANTPDLAGQIRKKKMMHEVSMGEIDVIVQPTVLFSHTDELKIPELVDADTNPSENLQDNGAMP